MSFSKIEAWYRLSREYFSLGKTFEEIFKGNKNFLKNVFLDTNFIFLLVENPISDMDFNEVVNFSIDKDMYRLINSILTKIENNCKEKYGRSSKVNWKAIARMRKVDFLNSIIAKLCFSKIYDKVDKFFISEKEVSDAINGFVRSVDREKGEKDAIYVKELVKNFLDFLKNNKKVINIENIRKVYPEYEDFYKALRDPLEKYVLDENKEIILKKYIYERDVKRIYSGAYGLEVYEKSFNVGLTFDKDYVLIVDGYNTIYGEFVPFLNPAVLLFLLDRCKIKKLDTYERSIVYDYLKGSYLLLAESGLPRILDNYKHIIINDIKNKVFRGNEDIYKKFEKNFMLKRSEYQGISGI